MTEKNNTLTLLKAIRAKCVDCCGGVATEADQCPVRSCPLHPFRSGKPISLLQKPGGNNGQLSLISGDIKE